MNGDRNDKFPLAFICTICYNIIKHSVDAECTCRYSIVVITSVSQTDEAGSIPVICSSAEQARATSRLRSSEPFSCFRALHCVKAALFCVWRDAAPVFAAQVFWAVFLFPRVALCQRGTVSHRSRRVQLRGSGFLGRFLVFEPITQAPLTCGGQGRLLLIWRKKLLKSYLMCMEVMSPWKICLHKNDSSLLPVQAMM